MAAIGFLLVILFILSLFIRLNIRVEFSHDGNGGRFTVDLRAFMGIVRYRWEKAPAEGKDKEAKGGGPDARGPERDREKEKGSAPEKIKKAMENFQIKLEEFLRIKTIAQNFFKKVKIFRLEWVTVVGAGDAALTGLFSGVLWGIKGTVLGVLGQNFSLRTRPLIHVSPDFQREIAETRFLCMIQFRLGHAIFAGTKILQVRRKATAKRENRKRSANL